MAIDIGEVRHPPWTWTKLTETTVELPRERLPQVDPKLLEQVDVVPHGAVLLRCSAREVFEPIADRLPSSGILVEQNGPRTVHIENSMRPMAGTVKANMSPMVPRQARSLP